MKVYLDASVVVASALHEEPRAEAAAKILARIENGLDEATTASLTVDEIVWVAIRRASRETAIALGRRFLALANLRVVPVSASDMVAALNLMAIHKKLRPRNAVHLAIAKREGISSIASLDGDFDGLPGIDRVRT